MDIFVQNQEQLDSLFDFLDKARHQQEGFRVVKRDRPLNGQRGVLAFFTDVLGKEHVCEVFYQYAEPIQREVRVGPTNAEQIMTDCLERKLPYVHDARRHLTGFVDYSKSEAYLFDEITLDALSDPLKEKWRASSSKRDFEYATYKGMTHLFKESPELERLLVEDQLRPDEIAELFCRHLKEHVFLKQHPGSCIR